MPFKEGVFHNGGKGQSIGRPPLFDACGQCGHEFEEDEKIWKRFRRKLNLVRIIAYYCQKCYDGMYIDV